MHLNASSILYSESEDDNFIECILITLKWHCTGRCKPLLESDVSSIIEVRRYFDEPINHYILLFYQYTTHHQQSLLHNRFHLYQQGLQ